MPTNKVKTEKLKVSTSPKLGRASKSEMLKVKSPVIKKEVKKTTVKAGNLIAPMYDVKGAKNGTFVLPKEIFGAKINDVLMAQAVRVYLANQRQGNAHTKTRGEIDLTKAKWYRQKGTGRARHGAKSAPIFVGGGVAHGPRKHSFSLVLPKKMRRVSLVSALSQKAKDGEITVLSGFSKIEPKTKIMNQVLIKITDDSKNKKKILFVTSGSSKDLPNIFRAGRNIENLELMSANLLNTYEVLKHRNLFMMKESVEVLAGEGSKN